MRNIAHASQDPAILSLIHHQEFRKSLCMLYGILDTGKTLVGLNCVQKHYYVTILLNIRSYQGTPLSPTLVFCLYAAPARNYTMTWLYLRTTSAKTKFARADISRVFIQNYLSVLVLASKYLCWYRSDIGTHYL